MEDAPAAATDTLLRVKVCRASFRVWALQLLARGYVKTFPCRTDDTVYLKEGAAQSDKYFSQTTRMKTEFRGAQWHIK